MGFQLGFAGPLLGSEYLASRGTTLPRLPNHLMDGAAFLFRTKEEAKKRARIGGTAFLVTKEIKGSKEAYGRSLFIPYFISCRHVVFSGGASVVSINRRDGGKPDILEFEPTDWVEHPKGDDVVAICAQGHVKPMEHRYASIENTWLLTPEVMDHYEMGVGDEVFMIGRFINHQGQKENRASARFGSISMMLEDIWVKNDNRFQEGFSVEMRSRTGFSGSPVAVYRTPSTVLANVKVPDFWAILGINWGYVLDENSENTWLNGVVPAWKIIDLLEFTDLKKQHEQHERAFHKRVADHKRSSGIEQAFAGEPDLPANDANPTHREDFTRLVGAAARKPPQEG
jgi:hypothetical protein